MTPGGVELVGMAELRKEIEALPEAVALQIQNRARALVPVDSGVTRDSIGVTPDLPHKQYIVGPGPAPHHRASGRTANVPMLPIWLEYGTAKMAARPFMRPAADEEQERYWQEINAAVDGIVG
jgi:HK97 gp10 family phage protein